MKIDLFTQVDTTVLLPSSFEHDERLEAIFDAAFALGARETCSIGPSIKWENMERADAIRLTLEAVNKACKKANHYD